MITFSSFQQVDIRVGRVVSVSDFLEAHKPSYILHIDFGPGIGLKKSSAQLVSNYTKEDLLHRLVLCVVNFPPLQIGSIKSEVLVLGVPDSSGECVLIQPDRDVPLGGKLY
ncbi:MAG: tRNA-binding protein [Candidatus Heimdallarchaeaceae archaeon]